jgi:hypothetical protein
LALAALMACQRVEPISGTADGIAIKASFGNPGAMAAQHCANFGKQAVLVDTVPLAPGVTADAIYHFRCQP